MTELTHAEIGDGNQVALRNRVHDTEEVVVVFERTFGALKITGIGLG